MRNILLVLVAFVFTGCGSSNEIMVKPLRFTLPGHFTEGINGPVEEVYWVSTDIWPDEGGGWMQNPDSIPVFRKLVFDRQGFLRSDLNNETHKPDTTENLYDYREGVIVESMGYLNGYTFEHNYTASDTLFTMSMKAGFINRNVEEVWKDGKPQQTTVSMWSRVTRTVFHYDSLGLTSRVVTRGYTQREYRYEYLAFDELANWTSRIEYITYGDATGPQKIVRTDRLITYYD